MRPEKQLLRDEIADYLESNDSFVLMSYSRFGANKTNDFRNRVHEIGGNMEVVRKRILLKAAEKAGLDLGDVSLDGHISLVFAGEDPLAMTKLVCTASKENKDSLIVIGGRFDGSLLSAEQVIQLSELPSKDEMRAQLLATLEAPLSNTLAVMDALLTSVMHCMENRKKD